MGENKSWWVRVKEWAIKRPVRCAVIGVILLPVITLVVLLWRYGGFCRDEWAGLAGGLLAYAGTCFVGILAVWQNQRFKAENDAAQTRLEEIYQNTLDIEMWRDKPVFRITIRLVDFGDKTITHEFFIKNIGQTAIRDGEIFGFKVGNGEYIQNEHTITLTGCQFGAMGPGDSEKYSMTSPLKEEIRKNDTLFARAWISYTDLAGRITAKDLYFCIGPFSNNVTKEFTPVTKEELIEWSVL